MVAHPATSGHTSKATPQKPVPEVRKGTEAHTGAQALMAVIVTLGLPLRSLGLPLAICSSRLA